MRAAPVAGDSQVRVIRTCGACAHASDDSLDGAIAALRAGPAALDPVRALVREAFGFAARFRHFPIIGLCPACPGG